MKKRKCFRKVYLYVKRMSNHFEMLKVGHYNLQVDLGRKR